MSDTHESAPRVFEPGVYIPYLARVPVLVSLILVVTLSDVAIPGSMQEALRYSIVDQPHQLIVIAAALLVACLAIRFTAEAMIELVAPELYNNGSTGHFLSHFVPRFLSAALGFATATPLLKLACDTRSLPSPHDRMVAVGLGALCILVGLAVSLVPKGPHAPTFALRRTNFLMRLVYALLPLLLATAFAGADLGLLQPDSGIADHALERYVTAIVGLADDGSQANGPLQSYMHDASGAPVLRYEQYVRPAPYAASTVSPLLILAELVSLFASCIAVRLSLAIFFDLVFPGFGGEAPFGTLVRNLLPRLASAGLGIGVGAQMLLEYFKADVALSPNEVYWVWGIAATFSAIGILASLGPGSTYAAAGPWRDSPSVGRRFLGAARRISSLDPRWQWFIGGLQLAGLVVFLLFADVHFVRITQWVGPVGIILLWGFTASAFFFPLAYLSHMTRIPMLTILLLAAMTFAGFDLNDNHELRVVRNNKNAAALTAPSKAKAAIQSDVRQDLDLASWIASRQDWNKYDRYPVFLIATEGGGIRAAYFTASVLAALQERCPALAQHTLAISGVSGGSVGAAVFAGLAGDHASNTADPTCNLDGVQKPGAIVNRARAVLGTDLLSPLLGAMLFPDAFQRIVPVPIPKADRSRAIEYALQDSWTKATVGDCGRCDAQRMAERAMDLYGKPAPENAVPNLFLNTTDADTGRTIPYTTMRVQGLATPFRDQAEIDDGSFDTVEPSAHSIENLSLEDRMADDRIPLSTAAVVSARFPYLTPAGRVGYSGGDYVDGGYFENSGTYLLSGLVQYLIGQQQSYAAGKSPQLDAARKAVFIVIVIESEPCTRDSPLTGCDEDATVQTGSWNEALSPLRALLSTRDMRAAYSLDGLNAVSALVEQFSAKNDGAAANDGGTSCDYPICAVTLRFRNRTHTDIPLSWVLSSEGRKSMDNAVDGMEMADVRLKAPPQSTDSLDDPQDIDRVLGSYRRVLCVLAARTGEQGCAKSQPVQAALTSGQKSVSR